MFISYFSCPHFRAESYCAYYYFIKISHFVVSIGLSHRVPTVLRTYCLLLCVFISSKQILKTATEDVRISELNIVRSLTLYINIKYCASTKTVCHALPKSLLFRLCVIGMRRLVYYLYRTRLKLFL